MAKPKTPTLTKEEKKALKKEFETTKAECVDFLVKGIDAWAKHAKKRLDKIKEMELSYNGEVRPTLKGRSNFPFPVLAKYVDELMGRLDDLPAFRIGPFGRNAMLLVAQKIQAAIDILKKPTMGDWARQDRMGRMFSIFAGYCAFDFYTEVDERKGFMARARPIDHNDFVFDPFGGNDLENHRYLGEFPILKNENDISDRVALGLYDEKAAKRLLANVDKGSVEKNQTALMGRYARYKALGIDIENANSADDKIFALAQMQCTFRGTRYMATFDYATKICLRFEKLDEVFKASKGMYSYDLYQTHENPNSVMCKAPVDDIYAVAEGMRVKVNQIFDASTKQLWGMKMYDPNFFPDPSQLEWRRPDQLVVARAYNGKPISQGIHTVDTQFDYAGNVGFVKFLDGFLASVVGISPNEVSEETKRVGVLFGQLQKTAARLGVQNKSYAEMWMRGLLRFIFGMKDNMDEPMAVKLIGSRGVEWDELTKKELSDPESFEIIVEGSTVEQEMNEAMRQSKQKALEAIKSDPDLKKEINPKWMIEEILKTGNYTPEDVRRATDVKNYGSEESISRADLAIEEILKGKKPRLYLGADLAFMTYIFNYATRLSTDDKYTADERVAIMEYGRAHKDIVVKNMAGTIVDQLAQQGIAPDAMKLPPGTPPPGPPVAPKGPIVPGNAIPTPPLPGAPVAPPVGAPGA